MVLLFEGKSHMRIIGSVSKKTHWQTLLEPAIWYLMLDQMRKEEWRRSGQITKDLGKWPRYQKQHRTFWSHGQGFAFDRMAGGEKMTMAKNGFKRKVPDSKELTTILLTHTLTGTQTFRYKSKTSYKNSKQQQKRQITQVTYFSKKKMSLSMNAHLNTTK